MAEDNAVMSRLFKKFIYNFETRRREVVGSASLTTRTLRFWGRNATWSQIKLITAKNGGPLLHLVRECPRAYHSAYSVSVNSPYMESINKVIGQTLAAGLFKSWFFNNMSQHNGLKMNQETWSENVTFSLEHLTVAFTTLVVGLFWLLCFHS
ncbi:hypothetical protein LSTR_LSTR012277 [Laodelphax striatellus]|uniref:Uncharacterized protein n=1 Tax=Laodelphax striatellus TaxID=195883 RepID=A0A482WLI8_LAOST|nr:hypothetical protein LSTR_LSTR012277 [Laodelphax striatellus]